MADHSRSPPQNFLRIKGISKAYKSLVSKRFDKNQSSQNQEAAIDEACIDRSNQGLREEEQVMNGVHSFRYNDGYNKSPNIFIKERNVDNYFTSALPMSPLSRSTSPSPKGSPCLSRTASRRSTTPTPTPRGSPSLSSSASRRSTTPTPTATPRGSPSLSRNASRRSTTPTPTATPRGSPSLSRSASRCTTITLTPTATATPSTASGASLKSTSRGSIDASASASLSRSASRITPIMFSNSNGLVKPPAIEKKLECTLEELCFGCIKKINITRDVITNHGQVAQEDEMLTIKVKPGWKKGTKITFEGMGSDTYGAAPADITFVISEKRHSMFRRNGDDLEMVVEIPLVKALTGCTISIPLLGGEKMSLAITDIISPGYEKVIAGQGMPKQKEEGKRGNLIITFLVCFPTELTPKQRSAVFSILQEAC